MVRYELSRWSGRASVVALLAAPAALGAFTVWQRRNELLGDLERVEAGEIATATDVTAFEGMAIALQSALMLLPYILLGLASQSVAGEFSQGTLRNVLLRPLQRLQVMIGKQLALISEALGAYTLVLAAAFGAAAWAFDFEDVTEILANGRRFPLVPADDLWPELGRALWAPLLPLLAYSALGMLAGTVVRRGATGLALALGLGVLLDMSRAGAAVIETVSPAAYIPSPLKDTSFLDYYYWASQGVSNVTFRFESTEILVPCVWLVGCFVLACLIFRRRFVP